MKYLWMIMLVGSFSLLAEEQANEKKYTEEDFTKKVTEEVKKKIETIKNKSFTELTKELVDKEEKLNLKEMELVKKEDQLKVNALELEKKIQDFDKKQTSVLGCLDKNENESKERIRQQVEIISNMQPAKAAQLLSVQEADIAVQILKEIDTKKASKIFNLMEKEVSARLQKQYLDMKK